MFREKKKFTDFSYTKEETTKKKKKNEEKKLLKSDPINKILNRRTCKRKENTYKRCI